MNELGSSDVVGGLRQGRSERADRAVKALVAADVRVVKDNRGESRDAAHVYLVRLESGGLAVGVCVVPSTPNLDEASLLRSLLPHESYRAIYGLPILVLVPHIWYASRQKKADLLGLVYGFDTIVM